MEGRAPSRPTLGRHRGRPSKIGATCVDYSRGLHFHHHRVDGLAGHHLVDRPGAPQQSWDRAYRHFDLHSRDDAGIDRCYSGENVARRLGPVDSQVRGLGDLYLAFYRPRLAYVDRRRANSDCAWAKNHLAQGAGESRTLYRIERLESPRISTVWASIIPAISSAVS